MAKRDKSKKTTDRKPFANNPFKDLKGLSASAPVVASTDQQQSDSGEQRGGAPDKRDGDLLFVKEMNWLGVQPIDNSPKDIGQDEERPSDRRKTTTLPAKTSTELERQEFQAAIDELGRGFSDSWTEWEAPGHATPRRMRRLERGQLRPEAELDLHGFSREEALHRVRYFLENAVHHGYKTVLLITGKGHHSPEGPVLRDAVEKLLSTLRHLVVEWGGAPRRYGGSGVLVAFLREKPRGAEEQ